MMLDFIYALKEGGVPVSVQYILDFYRALERGLAPDLDRLFILARLVFVKRIEHYDVFEQVFAAHFLGLEAMPGGPSRFDLLAEKPFQQWLREQLEAGNLSRQAVRHMSNEELLGRFWETVLAQDGAHHGGNTWVGTGGGSPFGHSGRHGGGIRVYDESRHHTAQQVIGRRRFVNYRDDTPIAAENLRQVLASLKSLRPVGPPSELDVDETIYRTARNGGEIELVFGRELRNRVRLIVLLDNGGYSMAPHIPLVKTVFNKIRDQFRDVCYYYFHNCIYGVVYRNAARTRPLKWDDLLASGRATRLIIIGDANMAPMELMASHGSIDLTTSDPRPGYEWLQDLHDYFPASIWLNPIAKPRWPRESTSILQVARIFAMEDLTLGGIKNAVAYLNEQGKLVDHL